MIGNIYIDKDIRMFKRALRIIAIQDSKAVCEAGFISKYGKFEAFVGRCNRPKIAVSRLETPRLFKQWSEGG